MVRKIIKSIEVCFLFVGMHTYHQNVLCPKEAFADFMQNKLTEVEEVYLKLKGKMYSWLTHGQ